MPEITTIVWFRNDLRIVDNPALHLAAGRGAVVPVFIHAPEEEGSWAAGGAARWWTHQSLRRLDAALRRIGSRLIVRRSSGGHAGARRATPRRDGSRSVLLELARETGATAVVWNRRHDPIAGARDAEVERRLRAAGIAVEIFEATLLFDPALIRTRSGAPFQVFTPFSRACAAAPPPAPPLPAPRRIAPPERWPATIELDTVGLLPVPDWAAGLRAAWRPGETEAMDRLGKFLRRRMAAYAAARDRLDQDGTSSLSPHLHFGEIGPRQIWHAVNEAVAAGEAGHRAFLRQILWREFAHHLLIHFPHTAARPLRSGFERFPWRRDARRLRAWQRGRTGYPIVDSGMRALWATGWMHNRVRMIVASFLVKDLLQHWREGARWFWDTLVDADLANNTLGWQWAAGCGADAAPFFRIFNPVLQGEKFDPRGDYVRRWVPEIARLPARWIHRPWAAPAKVLAAAGVVIGRHYPRPIVDHAAARIRALAAWEGLRRSGSRRGRR